MKGEGGKIKNAPLSPCGRGVGGEGDYKNGMLPWSRRDKGLTGYLPVFIIHEAMGHCFRLDGRKDDVARIGNDHRPRSAPVGGVNQLPSLLRIADDPLDGSRLWTDNGHHSVGRHDITKTDIDQLNLTVHDKLTA
jgi:hypothetical protein